MSVNTCGMLMSIARHNPLVLTHLEATHVNVVLDS